MSSDTKKTARPAFDQRNVGGFVAGKKPIFTFDSKYVVCASGNDVALFSSQTGQQVALLVGHTHIVTEVFLNPLNPLQLVSTSSDRTIKFWDLSDYSLLQTVKVDAAIQFAVMTKGPAQRIFFASKKIKKQFVNPFNVKHDRFGETERITSKVVSGKSAEGDLFSDLNRTKHKSFRQIGLRKKDKDVRYQEALNESYAWSLYTYSPSTNSVELVANFDFQVSEMIIDPTFQYIALLSGKTVYIYHIPTGTTTSRSSKITILSIAFHPTKPCLAVGDRAGGVEFWYCLSDGTNDKMQNKKVSKFHWHHQPVTSLGFTEDGTYLFTGGYEGVVVMWHIETGRKKFCPGYLSTIRSISVNSIRDRLTSPSGSSATLPSVGYVMAIGIDTNTIHLVNASNFESISIIQGISYFGEALHRMHTKRNARILHYEPVDGLVVVEGPRSGMLSFLRWKNGITGEIVSQLEVVRTFDDMMEQIKRSIVHIEHVAFDPKGEWLVTVERRLYFTGRFPNETVLKFWYYDRSSRSYQLNTRIDNPHKTNEVTSLAFHPSRPLVITTCSTGDFNVWATVSKKSTFFLSTIKKQKESMLGNEEVDNSDAFWRCKSSSAFNNVPASHSCFSHDGSLVAVANGPTVSFWDVSTMSLRSTLSHSIVLPLQSVLDMCFIVDTPFFVTVTEGQLYVWNLLKMEIWWSADHPRITKLLHYPSSKTFGIVVKKAAITEIAHPDLLTLLKGPSDSPSSSPLLAYPDLKHTVSSETPLLTQDRFYEDPRMLKKRLSEPAAAVVLMFGVESPEPKNVFEVPLAAKINRLNRPPTANAYELFFSSFALLPAPKPSDSPSILPFVVASLQGEAKIQFYQEHDPSSSSSTSSLSVAGSSAAKILTPVSMLTDMFGSLRAGITSASASSGPSTDEDSESTWSSLFQTEADLAMFAAPSHLIPPLPKLYPSFIESLFVKKSDASDSSMVDDTSSSSSSSSSSGPSARLSLTKKGAPVQTPETAREEALLQLEKIESVKKSDTYGGLISFLESKKNTNDQDFLDSLFSVSSSAPSHVEQKRSARAKKVVPEPVPAEEVVRTQPKKRGRGE